MAHTMDDMDNISARVSGTANLRLSERLPQEQEMFLRSAKEGGLTEGLP